MTGMMKISDCGNDEIERGLFTYEQLDGELDRVQHRLNEIDRLHESGIEHRAYYQERERVLLAKIDKHFGQKKIPDIEVENHGSVFLLRSLTTSGQEWLDEHMPEDAQWLGNAIACEPRYAVDIVVGMQQDGLFVV